MFSLKHLIYFLTLSKHFDDQRAENKAYTGVWGAHLLALHNTSTECSSSSCYGFYMRTLFCVSACKENELQATLKLNSIWLNRTVIIVITEVPSTNHSPSNLSSYKVCVYINTNIRGIPLSADTEYNSTGIFNLTHGSQLPKMFHLTKSQQHCVETQHVVLIAQVCSGTRLLRDLMGSHCSMGNAASWPGLSFRLKHLTCPERHRIRKKSYIITAAGPPGFHWKFKGKATLAPQHCIYQVSPTFSLVHLRKCLYSSRQLVSIVEFVKLTLKAMRSYCCDYIIRQPHHPSHGDINLSKKKKSVLCEIHNIYPKALQH